MSLLKSIKQYMKTGNIKENYTATIPIKDDSVSIELKDVNKTYKTYKNYLFHLDFFEFPQRYVIFLLCHFLHRFFLYLRHDERNL